MKASRSQKCGDGTRSPSSPRPPHSDGGATTKAGDWFDARQAGARLAPHVLPDDTDVQLWTHEMENRP